MDIRAQIKALYDQAATRLAEVGTATDADAVKSICDEVEGLKAQALQMERALDLQGQLTAPVMPAPLPVAGAMGTQPVAQSAPDPAVKAIYQVRFGDEDDGIRAILTDLHGADYDAQRWQHMKTFSRWLRDYTNPTIPPEGRKFLWTPGSIKIALREGQDVAAMKTTMIEASSTLGGYIVPEDWRASIVERLAAESVMRSRATVATTSRDMYEQPKATGGDAQYTAAVRVTWVDETPVAGTAATNLTWGMEKIPIFTVMAETFFSRSQVEDAAFNLPAYLADKLAEAALIDEDNQFLTGDGQGKPYGILTGSTNGNGLAEVASGDARSLTWNGLIDLYYGIPARYRKNAVWAAQNATYATIAKMNSGTGGEYYWRKMYAMHAGSTTRPMQLMMCLNKEISWTSEPRCFS